MKLLVLGGTRFLGRHLVEAALEAGVEVTVFTRGVTPSPWSATAVTHLIGNRDPRIDPGHKALESGEWDAAVDMSGYVPRSVAAGAQCLKDRVAHYTFVSSMSVYADSSRPGLDESTPVATLDDPATEDILPNYGALKAACEDAVRAAFGSRALIVRPGLIVGPHDPTDRFPYWVARFLLPGQLGARPGTAVVPAPAARPIQFVDARDLAQWLLGAATEKLTGTFNACSPAGMWTMGMLVDALLERARTPPPKGAARLSPQGASALGRPGGAHTTPPIGAARLSPQGASALGRPGGAHDPPVVPRWIDEATLVAQGVEPWTGLPLWIPSTDAESAGFMEFSCDRAIAHGLRIRPLAQTIDDTAAWLAAKVPVSAWRDVLSADKERELLESQ